MPSSIYDVAKAAGVSVATVSRVLNSSPYVTGETLANVQNAIRKLHYQKPTTGQRGRPMKVVRTGSVAVLIPDNKIEAMRTALTGSLLHGIERTLTTQGLNLLLTILQPNGSLPSCLEKKQTDGVIIRSTDMARQKLLETDLPAIPRVWVFEPSTPPKSGDVVQPDNEAIGHMAVEYLMRSKCSSFTVLNANASHAAGVARSHSFLEAAKLHGMPAIALKPTSMLEMIGAFLKLKPRSPGIFLPLGDAVVEEAYRALVAHGIQPGVQVRVVSCNNDLDRLRALDPKLPNIDIQAAEIGRIAAGHLIQRLSEPDLPPKRTLIAPRLDLP